MSRVHLKECSAELATATCHSFICGPDRLGITTTYFQSCPYFCFITSSNLSNDGVYLYTISLPQRCSVVCVIKHVASHERDLLFAQPYLK